MHDGIEKLAGVHGMERVCRVNAFEGEENGKKTHLAKSYLMGVSWGWLSLSVSGDCYFLSFSHHFNYFRRSDIASNAT